MHLTFIWGIEKNGKKRKAIRHVYIGVCIVTGLVKTEFAIRSSQCVCYMHREHIVLSHYIFRKPECHWLECSHGTSERCSHMYSIYRDSAQSECKKTVCGLLSC